MKCVLGGEKVFYILYFHYLLFSIRLVDISFGGLHRTTEAM